MSLLEVLFALTILSVLFLGVTDLILGGRATSALYQRKLVASQYADNIAEVLALRSCKDLASGTGKDLSPVQLNLVYEPTAEEAQMLCSVRLDKARKTLFRARVSVRDPKGVLLAERKLLVSCDAP